MGLMSRLLMKRIEANAPGLTDAIKQAEMEAATGGGATRIVISRDGQVSRLPDGGSGSELGGGSVTYGAGSED